MDWSLREGYSWAEDKEHCEEYGRMLQADPSKVSRRAKKRGLPQMGTLGAGNHYAEIQVVEKVHDKHAAREPRKTRRKYTQPPRYSQKRCGRNSASLSILASVCVLRDESRRWS